MTPQDWHALRRLIKARHAEVAAGEVWQSELPRIAAMRELERIARKMTAILYRRRQRKQVA